MIDFRYHLVSLVAVFLALAVGIVLGAGPLGQGLSDTLDEEVAQLRTERSELRSELETVQARAAAKDEALGVLGGRAAAGTLTGVRVGVVMLPGADRNRVAQAEDLIEEAGGELVLTGELDEDWEGGDVDRDDLVSELAPTLALPLPQDDGGPTLAAVVGAILAGSDSGDQVGGWLAAADRLDEEGLLELSWTEDSQAEVLDRRPPEVVLLVGGGLDVLAETPEDAEGVAALRARTELVRTLTQLDLPVTVAAAGTEGDVSSDEGLDPLLAAVREESGLADQVSSVDNLESASGVIATALALGWELQAESGHYGLGEGAQALVPAPPPQRFLSSPTDPADDARTEPAEPVPDDPTGRPESEQEPVPDDATPTTSP